MFIYFLFFFYPLQIVSAAVAVILSFIFNINDQPDQKKAELLNNISLIFKSVGIVLNIMISIFFSIELEGAVEPKV